MYVINDNYESHFFYENNGNGTFARIEDAGLNCRSCSEGVACGDYDNDGFLDLYVANRNDRLNELYKNNGDGTFSRIDGIVITEERENSFGACWGDYDNDGDLDLFVSNTGNNSLYENTGSGDFVKVTEGDIVHDGGNTSGAKWADYDNDGYLELCAASQYPNLLYDNLLEGNNRIEIKCRGLSTCFNTGGSVYVTADIDGQAVTQMRVIPESCIAHFGLKNARTINEIIVVWPAGNRTVLHDVAVNQKIVIEETGEINRPILRDLGNQTIREGQTLEFTVSAIYADESVLRYSALNLPAGAVLDSVPGEFLWTPSYNAAGTYTVTFIVQDNRDLSKQDRKTIDITVVNVNSVPVAAAQSVSTNEDIQKAITLTGSDPDGSPLNYAIVTQPAHGTLSGALPNLTYTPNANYNGSDSFTFKVSDGTSDSVPAVVSVTINHVNDAPVAVDMPDLSIDEDRLLDILVQAEDADGDVLRYDFEQPHHGSIIAEIPGLPNLVYRPDPNYNGSDSFTFTATDTQGLISQPKTVNITVNRVNDAPVASSLNIETNEDESVDFLIGFSDPDGDRVWKLSLSGPSHGRFYVLDDGQTRYAPDRNYHGSDRYEYQAYDGTLRSENQTINITVRSVNDNPVMSDTNGPFEMHVGEGLNFRISASDQDGDNISFRMIDNPLGAVLNSSTGGFSWCPGMDEAGRNYNVTFIAEDGNRGEDRQTTEISVINRPPVLNPIRGETKCAGQTLRFTAEAVDPDGHRIIYSLDDAVKPAGASINSGNGRFRWLINGNQIGIHHIVVIASDGKGGEDRETFLVQVPNRNPVLESIGNKSIEVGSRLSFRVRGTDADGHSLNYTCSNLPAGAVFEPFGNAYKFTWTPSQDQAGIHQVTFTIDDGYGARDSETIQINVNNPPRINVSGVNLDIDGDNYRYVGEAGGAVNLHIDAVDADNDNLVYSIEGQPEGEGCIFRPAQDGQGYTFMFPAGDDDTGNYFVTFSVMDEHGAQDRKTVEIIVTATFYHINFEDPVYDKAVLGHGAERTRDDGFCEWSGNNAFLGFLDQRYGYARIFGPVSQGQTRGYARCHITRQAGGGIYRLNNFRMKFRFSAEESNFNGFSFYLIGKNRVNRTSTIINGWVNIFKLGDGSWRKEININNSGRQMPCEMPNNENGWFYIELNSFNYGSGRFNVVFTDMNNPGDLIQLNNLRFSSSYDRCVYLGIYTWSFRNDIQHNEICIDDLYFDWDYR